MDTEITSHVRDRPTGLGHLPHRTLTQLVGYFFGAAIEPWISHLPRRSSGFKVSTNSGAVHTW